MAAAVVLREPPEKYRLKMLVSVQLLRLQVSVLPSQVPQWKLSWKQVCLPRLLHC